MNTENTNPYKEPDSQLLGPDKPDATAIQRKDLLPLWVKIFSWLFIVAGGVATVAFVAAIFGIHSRVELYGITSNGDLGNIFSWIVFGLFMFSGLAAYGLLFAKDWAVKLCLVMAYITLAVLLFVTAVNLYVGNLMFRLELIVLIPYMFFLHRISDDWAARKTTP